MAHVPCTCITLNGIYLPAYLVKLDNIFTGLKMFPSVAVLTAKYENPCYIHQNNATILLSIKTYFNANN